MKKPEPATPDAVVPDAVVPDAAHPPAAGPPALLRIVGLDTLLLVRGEEDTYLSDKMGYCDFRQSRIVLSQGNSPTSMRETAVHEVLHAVDHAVQSGLSEQDVHRLGRALYAVLRDNPEFTRWLLL